MNENETKTTPEATGAAPAAEAAAEPAAGQGNPAAEGGEKMNKLQQFLADMFGKEGDGAQAQDGAGKEDGPADEVEAKIDAAVKEAQKTWEAERAAKAPAAADEKADEPDLSAENAALKAELLKKTALTQLEGDGYPAGLADLLDYSDKETMDKSAEKVTGIFQAALGEAVRTRLKGNTPEGLGSSKATGSTAIHAQIRKGIRGE